jgi:type VI secretion system lysozyme-like protein
MLVKPVSVNKPLLQRLIATGADQISREDYLVSIKQDVEALLNTFSADYVWGKELAQLNHSLLNFGISNYLKKNYNGLSNQALLCTEIKKLIEAKEPRFANLYVSVVDEHPDTDLILYLCIEATLNLAHDHADVILELKLDSLTMGFKLL